MEVIDLESWPRREHNRFFAGLAFPFFSVTTSLDVTRLRECCKSQGLSFYYALIYVTLSVMNEIPEFLYKIRGAQVVRHETLHPSFVVLDGQTRLFRIVNAPFAGTMEEFCAQCEKNVAAQKAYFPSLEDEKRDDLVYFSSLPWVSFTSLSNEMDADPDDSIPRVTWGKFEEREGRWRLPYSVQLNHRLLDGWHLGELIRGIERVLDEK